MSHRGHKGRCFRQHRRAVERKGDEAQHPIRWKVPLAIRPFLNGAKNQRRARHDEFGLAIARYVKHQQATGIGPQVRALGDVLQ